MEVTKIELEPLPGHSADNGTRWHWMSIRFTVLGGLFLALQERLLSAGALYIPLWLFPFEGGCLKYNCLKSQSGHTYTHTHTQPYQLVKVFQRLQVPVSFQMGILLHR